jgi:hypothetical protein
MLVIRIHSAVALHTYAAPYDVSSISNINIMGDRAARHDARATGCQFNVKL